VLNADRLGRKSEQEASGSEAPSLQRQNRRLRSGGDGYFDVLEINEDIWGRELHHRPQKQ
jgi:hypothetical protein